MLTLAVFVKIQVQGMVNRPVHLANALIPSSLRFCWTDGACILPSYAGSGSWILQAVFTTEVSHVAYQARREDMLALRMLPGFTFESREGSGCLLCSCEDLCTCICMWPLFLGFAGQPRD